MYCVHQPFGYLQYVELIGRGKSNNPASGCLGTPAVGPDDPRTYFNYNAYLKLNTRCYDASMREFVSPAVSGALKALYYVILLVTGGLVNLTFLLDRADGWLVDLEQPDYNGRVIDVSQPFEAAAAGGAPVPDPGLNFG